MFEHSMEFLQDVQRYFNKKYKFEIDQKWKLPENENSYFSEPPKQNQKLQQKKDHLNFVKSKLNDYPIEKWSVHTRSRNPCQGIIPKLKNEIKGEFVTQAFCKFYEIVHSYQLVDPKIGRLVSLHLCEAPGAFITSLNHYLKLKCPDLKWDFVASTLNPYYEGNSILSTILDDRFIFNTLQNWHFGADITGNIMSEQNIYSLKEYCDKLGPVHLVTSDGSIDCLENPEDQEEVVSKLHLAELLTTLLILADNGNMVLKMFTFFEHSSLEILYILNCCFQEVHVFKPATSKEGNSEVYVVAKRYKRRKMRPNILAKMIKNFLSESKCLIPSSQIPEDFVVKVMECADYFGKMQKNVIEQNIRFYHKNTKWEIERIRALREHLMQQFIEIYEVRPIEENKKILYGIPINNSNNLNVKMHSGKETTGSYTERRLVLDKEERLHIFYGKIRQFYDSHLLVMDPKNSQRPLKLKNLLNVDLSRFVSFTFGSKISRIKSSKFMYQPIFKLFVEIIEFTNQQLPQSNSNQKFIRNNNNLSVDIKFFKNCQTYNEYEKECVREISEFIKTQNFQRFNSVCIENLPLLTQFLVGFVLYLGQFVFEEVTLMNNNGIVCLRKLQDGGIDRLTHFTNQLNLTESVDNPRTVVGICDIKHLFQHDFYRALIDFNDSLCLKFCSFYLSENN